MNWANEILKLKQLAPWDENPKSISKAAAKRLLDYWQKIGQFQTLAVGPKNGSGKYPLYDGHQRLDVLLDHFGGDYEVAVAMLGSAALFWSVIISTDTTGALRLLAGVAISITLAMTVISNFFLMFSIKVEITRPIRKQLATRSKLFRYLDEK